MTSDKVLVLYNWLKQNGIAVWIDGGWCIDALLGEQTREHQDLDIAVERKDNAKLRQLLENNGYKEEKRNDSSEFMYVMKNEAGQGVDVHAFEYDENGKNIHGVEYPLGSLTGKGTINGQEVNCIDPEWMFKFKTSYEPKEKDIKDVQALSVKFGFELPDKYKSNLPIFLIAVDGHGGSGKSTLANLLSEKLNAKIIHTDDFAGWDNPLNWWPLVIERVFEPIQNGEKLLNYPRSKWWETHNPEPVVNQPVTPIMILEGVSSLRKEFRPYISYGIFVDTPIEVCLQRGFERDKGQDGKSDEEIKQMWEQWYEKEETYIKRDNPQELANLIIDGTKPLDETIKLVEKRVKSL